MDECKVREALDILTSKEFYHSANKVEELLKEALAPEPRFYVGQPVLIKSKTENISWHQVYVDCFENGKTLVRFGPDYNAFHAKEIKPDPDAVSLPNWIEHDGSDIYVNCSNNEFIVGIYDSSRDHYISGKDGNRLHLLGMSRYCIIPLPQWIA